VVFCNNDDELIYRFAYLKGDVYFERLENNRGEVFINRKDNKTIYYKEEINPPSNKLTLNVRRDIMLYPQVEEIIE